MNIESELVGNEITHLKPKLSKRRLLAEAIIGALAIAAFASGLIILALSISK